MATYKVLQDIEAEDKLLGPLSLRQFIYAAIVVVLGFLMFRGFAINPLLPLPLLPPALLFAVLAAPFGHDQSSEIWLLAKIRFMLKPRVRIWDQSGLQELVSITAPKREEHQLTNGLNETQVRSRLSALAQTIDTRGWAVKGMDINLYTSPMYSTPQASNDRLVDPSAMVPQQVADVTITSQDDMLDTHNNPVAQQLDQLVKASDHAHRQEVLDRMQQVREGKPLNQPRARQFDHPQQSYATFTPQTIQPFSTPPAATNDPLEPPVPPSLDEQLWANRFQQTRKQQQETYTSPHTRVIQPLGHTPSGPIASDSPALPAPISTPPVTNTPKPDILDLANNDDLSVATIARQANQRTQPPSDEVVISLH